MRGRFRYAFHGLGARFPGMRDRIPSHPEKEVFDRAVPLERAVEDPTSALIATLMDTAFVIPGTKIRFGFDALIGLFPGLGDSVGALISSVIIAQGARMGLPRIVLARMAGHILINTLVGAIPIVGDIFSVFYRSNVKNYELLRRYAGKRRAASAGDWFFVIGLVVLMLLVLTMLIVGVVILVKQVIKRL